MPQQVEMRRVLVSTCSQAVRPLRGSGLGSLGPGVGVGRFGTGERLSSGEKMLRRLCGDEIVGVEGGGGGWRPGRRSAFDRSSVFVGRSTPGGYMISLKVSEIRLVGDGLRDGWGGCGGRLVGGGVLHGPGVRLISCISCSSSS